MFMPPASGRWPRRDFLGLLAGGSAASLLVACAPSPLVTPGAVLSPMPAPTLDDRRRAAATAVAGLAALAQDCASLAVVDAGVHDWCAALADQHRSHVQVLAQADPLGGVQADHTPLEPIEPGAVPTPSDLSSALALLARQETALATLLGPTVSDADQSPSMALLWISLRLAARVSADALAGGPGASLGPAHVIGGAVPAQVEVGDLVMARQVLLSHQRALVFGLQALLGRIAFDDPVADTLGARLGEAMRERDLTAASISASGDEPQAPSPGYELPGDELDPAQREPIWGRLELAVLAGWVRVAAADAAERESACEMALLQAGRARSHGERLPYWPGWV